MASSRIHVLGLGSIGTFAAHALAEARNQAKTTLLLHRPSLFDDYIRNGKCISLRTLKGETINHAGYDFEVLNGGTWSALSASQLRELHGQMGCKNEPLAETIENLIVSVKAANTVDAIRSVRGRLGRNSTILFLQNGSGMVEAVNENIFTDPRSRPNYMLGVISHGVSTNGQFDITLTGPSATSLGMVPRQDTDGDSTNGINDGETGKSKPGAFLMEALCSVPRFNAKSYDFTDVLQLQLEKLAVNAYSNPIGALYDSSNSILKTMPEHLPRLMKEISSIVLKLPELEGISGTKERFSPERLQSTVGNIIEQNAGTTTSMCWDMRAGRTTEIQFICGYWSRRGREVGVETPVNDDLVARVEEMTRCKQQQR